MPHKKFNIFVYLSFGVEKPDHTFVANNKRQVVGLLKTIMDNYDPVHIDIMSEEDFNKWNDEEVNEND